MLKASVLPTIHFPAAMKTLVLCNLFKGLVLDLPSHSRAGILSLGKKMKEKMTIVLFRLIWGRDLRWQTARTNVMANLNLC